MLLVFVRSVTADLLKRAFQSRRASPQSPCRPGIGQDHSVTLDIRAPGLRRPTILAILKLETTVPFGRA